MSPEPTPTRHAASLSEIIAAYLQTVDEGKSPRQEELLQQHPALADELREFFATQQQVERTVGVATSRLKEGSCFGEYESLGEIARGGMGIVYRARHQRLNRVVALKMILAGHLANESDARRFKAEAEPVANLDHPNIVPIYEVGEYYG